MATTSRSWGSGERGLDATARRQSIIDAGWALLVEGGVRTVTVDGVLHRLDISRATYYRHFRYRVDLLVALYERYADDLVGTLEPVLRPSDLSIEGLMKASRTAYFDLAGRHGVAVRPLVEAAHGDPRMAEAQQRLREQTTTLWNVAVASRLTEQEMALFASREDVRVGVATMIELHQTLALDAATLWLTGARPRVVVEDILDVMTADLQQRLLDHFGADPPD